MGKRIQECEVRQGLLQGGFLLGAVAVCRPDGSGTEHLIWVRTSWQPGFHLLYTFKERGVRGYRDLDRLVALLRNDWGYRGPITLRLHDDPGLGLAEGVSPSLVRADGGRRPPRKPVGSRNARAERG